MTLNLEQHPLFVYGTLRPGEKNYLRFLAGRTSRTSPASVSGRLYFVVDGGYPYLLPGEDTVRGDLIELAPRHYESTLRRIDRLEEYDPRDEDGSIYLRRRVRARVAGGKVQTAWVYYWNCQEIEGVWIESGDFSDRPSAKRSNR